MTVTTYSKGDVIFRQGDKADSMFDILGGRIGIYLNYGAEDEKLLTELNSNAFFGEMGMIDHAPRSATAVALENRTKLQEITEDQLGDLFREQPGKVLEIMQQLSSRLRKLTNDYMDACKTAADVTTLEESGEDAVEDAEAINARVDFYANILPFGYTMFW